MDAVEDPLRSEGRCYAYFQHKTIGIFGSTKYPMEGGGQGLSKAGTALADDIDIHKRLHDHPVHKSWL